MHVDPERMSQRVEPITWSSDRHTTRPGEAVEA
jgi:hypothetical protein